MRAIDYAFFDTPFAAYAHRGGAHYPPNLGRENTVYAFQQAVDLGYRYLETDVHASSDGVLFAFHDAVLDRVTGQIGEIGHLSAAEVGALRISEADRIPRFAELLTSFPEARFNVDAKADAAVALLARDMAEHEAYDRVCVTSFSVRRLHELRRLLGRRVASSASAAGIAAARFLPWLTPVLSTPAPVLDVPLDRVVAGRRIPIVTPGLIDAAHRAGKRVHVWTIDDAPTMDRLIDLGVTGIFTDRIDTLKDVLVRRGLWS